MRRTSVGVGLVLALSLVAAPAGAVLPTASTPQLELPDGTDGTVLAEVSARPITPSGERALHALEAELASLAKRRDDLEELRRIRPYISFPGQVVPTR